MVAQTAAINLKLHNSGSMFGNFLPNLTTMGDILNKEGYQQVFLCGSEETLLEEIHTLQVTKIFI